MDEILSNLVKQIQFSIEQVFCKGRWGIKILKCVVFRHFLPDIPNSAIKWTYLHNFAAKNCTSCLTEWKKTCGKLPSSYRYHGNNHVPLFKNQNSRKHI